MSIDTIYRNDSTIIIEKGDTVFLERYKYIYKNVSVLCGLVKELCDLDFNKEDFLATMFGGIMSIVISLFSLL